MAEHESNRQRRTKTLCKICGASALYSYVGAIVCPSCKMFFKRNAQRKQVKNGVQCSLNGNCEITVNNRHLCSSCRLKKCLQIGMKAEMIRGCLSARVQNNSSIVRFPTMNLLQADQSTFTIEQWNDLSNIIHCYDEYGHLSIAERYLIDQNQLPLKMRFKRQSVQDVMTSLIFAGRSLFEKNVDFLSLPRTISTNLLAKTLKQICGLGTAFVLQKSQLIHNNSFAEVIKDIYGPSVFKYNAAICRRLSTDMIFFKIVLSILVFSTFDSVLYSDEMPIVLSDVKLILKIQDHYVELAWRYLLYRYGFQEAIRIFSDLVLFLLAFSNSVHAITDIEQYKFIVNALMKQTESRSSYGHVTEHVADDNDNR